MVELLVNVMVDLKVEEMGKGREGLSKMGK